ncbi:MAG: branched-chain amino acid ABC transporter substrate-binding protein [Xanthobacteraceae bacterium]
MIEDEGMAKLAGVAFVILLVLADAAQAQVKIGVVGPLSGPGKAYGTQFKNGASQAIEDINIAGGILNQKVIGDDRDDQADPEFGKWVADTLVQDRVNYVVGHVDSDVTLPASQIYEAAGILEITPSSTNTRITERGMWNIFRTCGRDDQQGEIAGSYIVQHFNGKNVAIVNDGTKYGAGLAEETKATINAHGMTEVLFDSINDKQEKFPDLVAKLKNLKVDIVYMASEHTQAAELLKEMRETHVMAVMMGGDGLSAEEFAEIAGPAAEGTLMTFAPDPRDRPEAQDVVERFRAKRIEPEAYTLYSYAAVQVIKQAVEMARTLDSRKVAAQITTGVKFKTVIGDLSYNKKGDITRYDYVMYKWQPDAGGKMIYREIR